MGNKIPIQSYILRLKYGMEKQKIKVVPMEWIRAEFGKQGEFKIKPYLSLDDKLKLSEAYLNAIFKNDDTDYTHAMKELEAEYAIVIGVVDLCTDLSIDNENDSGFENITSSGLWEFIRGQIENYYEFREELSHVFAHMREDISLEKSIGSTFDKLADKVMELIEQFSHADISDEGMKKAAETFKSSLETLQIEPPVPPVPLIVPEKKPRKNRVSKKESL
jgi:hypothetical protein